jgi:hypothetical protein
MAALLNLTTYIPSIVKGATNLLQASIRPTMLRLLKPHSRLEGGSFRRIGWKCFSTTTELDDLVELMHGRKHAERRDSVTEDILLDRKRHQDRIKDIEVFDSDITALEALGLGSKKRRFSVYQSMVNTPSNLSSRRKISTGSGDFCT